MTIPYERKKALEDAYQFLLSLNDTEKTPKVPKAIRERAYAITKHFPTGDVIERICEKVPEYFSYKFDNTVVYDVIKTEIRSMVNRKIGKENIDYVDITPGYDDTTQPCIFTTVFMKENRPPNPINPFATELTNNLRLKGEYRPVHILYRFFSFAA